MQDFLVQTWEELIARATGPLQFRLVLQPIMAVLLAVRAGWQDARLNQPVYFWAVVREPANRGDLLRNAWKDVGRLFLLGVALDLTYQLLVFQAIRPLQATTVATSLALIPYLIVRSLTNRFVTWWQRGRDKFAVLESLTRHSEQ